MDIQRAIAWGVFLAFVLMILFLDLFVIHRHPRELGLREALVGSTVPVVLAFSFLGCIYAAYQYHLLHLGLPSGAALGGHPHPPSPSHPANGRDAAVLFLTGYLVELSLSADNIFLFVLLMAFFQVPRALQHRVLFWGVLGALFMRGIMIVLGAALLSRFHWLIYVFGAFLLLTGIKMLLARQKVRDPAASLPLRLAKKVLPLHPGYDGQKFFTRINGRRLATTLLLVLVCIECTDLVFALDSIPAIFGITRDPFIVFTSNVFAILGLRSMYFLLAGVIDKFRHLKIGLALVLAFVGGKMLLPLAGWLLVHPDPHWDINQYLSLAIILGTLTLSIMASLFTPAPKVAASLRETPSPT